MREQLAASHARLLNAAGTGATADAQMRITLRPVAPPPGAFVRMNRAHTGLQEHDIEEAATRLEAAAPALSPAQRRLQAAALARVLAAPTKTRTSTRTRLAASRTRTATKTTGVSATASKARSASPTRTYGTRTVSRIWSSS
jgi:hypothetical protein